MDVSVGSVLHFYSHVAGKPKFHVVVCLEPKKLGLLINSRPTDFALVRPTLMACQPTILQVEHPAFLTHDSIVDCCDAISIAQDIPCLKPEDHVGVLSKRAKQAVLNGVEASKTINRGDKEMILSALSGDQS